jgi:hypothetical protein
LAEVWAAARDVGALHRRPVPGFVVDTKLEAGARVVTFGNGMVVREPIVSIDDAARRLVWSAEGGRATHYNATLEVLTAAGEMTRVVWTVDLLPDDMAPAIAAAMDAGMSVMKKTLDALALRR